MSYPLCYHNPMMKMKTETLFQVTRVRGLHNVTEVIRAYGLEHAKRVAKRLFGEFTHIEEIKTFPRFDERKIGVFNR